MKIKNIIPELVTDDIQSTLEFYTEKLKLELIAQYPEKNPEWIKLKGGDHYIMFESRNSLGEILPELNQADTGGSFNLYFEVENIERLYEDVKNQVAVILDLTEGPFRQFAFKDINGYLLLVGQHENSNSYFDNH